MRPLALSDAIAVAIEQYRTASGGSVPEHISASAEELADLVLEAYDARQAEYDLLTRYQRAVLARSWREHRRAEVIEERGGAAAGRPSVAPAVRQQTVEALLAKNLTDEFGHLTEAGVALARRAWQDAGEPEAGEPV